MPRDVTNVSYDYSDQVVLITGGARGQGRAHALAFARAGAKVVVADVAEDVEAVNYPLASKDQLDSVVAEVEALDTRALSFVCDVRDGARVQAMVEKTLAEFGKVDVLVNNAGVGSIHPIQEMTDEAWDAVVDTSLGGARNCSRAVAGSMIERGSGKIVNIGSVESFLALPNHSHYVAAKHGLLGLTRALAVELAPHGVNVNLVCPGAVETPLSAGINAMNPEWLELLAGITGRWNLFEPGVMLESEDVTQAVLWLSSDAAARVTGVSLAVDAGFTLI